MNSQNQLYFLLVNQVCMLQDFLSLCDSICSIPLSLATSMWFILYASLLMHLPLPLTLHFLFSFFHCGSPTFSFYPPSIYSSLLLSSSVSDLSGMRSPPREPSPLGDSCLRGIATEQLFVTGSLKSSLKLVVSLGEEFTYKTCWSAQDVSRDVRFIHSLTFSIREGKEKIA